MEIRQNARTFEINEFVKKVVVVKGDDGKTDVKLITNGSKAYAKERVSEDVPSCFESLFRSLRAIGNRVVGLYNHFARKSLGQWMRMFTCIALIGLGYGLLQHTKLAIADSSNIFTHYCDARFSNEWYPRFFMECDYGYEVKPFSLPFATMGGVLSGIIGIISSGPVSIFLLASSYVLFMYFLGMLGITFVRSVMED